MDGILIIDKPEGWTSHDVVARARRVLKEKRVGHTGTLDPFATGVLVLLVGRATRLAQFLSGAEKEYEATVRLGFATDTGDLTGVRREAERTADCATFKFEELEAALSPLRGEFGQVPPMYSAKKVGGRKLYELARKGEEVAREAVPVRVSEFEIVRDGGGSFLTLNEDATCDVRVRVVCSAGTYVRTLAESFGENLGTGAHLAALRRTRAGEFDLSRAISLEELPRLLDAGEEFLVPLEAALPHLPSAHLTAQDAARVRHGAAVRAEGLWEGGAHVALFDEGGALVAVGAWDAAAEVLRPRVMLAVEK
ncbi:MAG: tRNA pseudouridine(55) synthase TruB [Acidobacteria bacterium]|nr:tRNA pseudouridine(55) synthase TruB [Acidobacteriota bacterium]